MIRAPLPVTVVTGFLGAGKTTLLGNLLRDAAPRRLAVVVNEFGEISIDGALLRQHQRGAEVEIHDVAQGLLAYADDTDFVPLMLQLASRRALIDHVLIETSGLALPTAVMERLQDPLLAEHFVLDATLAVVDTPLLLTGDFDAGSDLATHGAGREKSTAGLFDRQLANADIVVLNKIDRLERRALLDAETQIRTRAPGVRFIELARQARLDPRLTLGLKLHEPGAGNHGYRYAPVRGMPAGETRPLGDHRRLDGHRHSGLAPHRHGVATHKHFHEHDPGWQSFTLSCADPLDAVVLSQALTAIAGSEPLMRVKGYAGIKGAANRLLIQGVRTRIETVWQNSADPAPPEEATEPLTEVNLPAADGTQLVFIGYHAVRSRIAEQLATLTGRHWS